MSGIIRDMHIDGLIGTVVAFVLALTFMGVYRLNARTDPNLAEHRDGQGERNCYGEENVEVLAHPPGFIWQVKQRQACAANVRIRGKVERGPRSGTWGFR